MKIRSSFVLAALFFGASANAQELINGDFLLNEFSPAGHSIRHFRADGTELQETTGGPGFAYEGATCTAGGLIMTSRRVPNGINLYDPLSGNLLVSFDTPEVVHVAGDTDVFSDGTLVVADQADVAHFYSEAGAHVFSISNGVTGTSFGIHVDYSDELWVCNLTPGSGDIGRIWHYDRLGNALGSFVTNFEPGDLVRASDGTLWVTDWNRNIVYHLSSAGIYLGDFTTDVALAAFGGIAIAPDDSLYVISALSTSIYHYDGNGVLLDQIPVGAATHSYLFLTLVDNAIDVVGNRYCFGDGSGTSCPCSAIGATDAGCPNSGGSGAVLTGLGEAYITNDSFQLGVSGVPGAKPGLILRGLNQVNGGAGVQVGDGLLCTSGQAARSQVQVTSAGNTLFSDFNGAPFGASSYGAGIPTNYQFWYRDTANSCTHSFNFSNAWTVTWLP